MSHIPLDELLQSIQHHDSKELLVRSEVLRGIRQDLAVLYFEPYMEQLFPEGSHVEGYQEIIQFLEDYELDPFVLLLVANALPVHGVAAYIGQLYPAFDIYPSEEEVGNIAYQSISRSQKWQGKALPKHYPVVVVDRFYQAFGDHGYSILVVWGLQHHEHIDFLGLWYDQPISVDVVLGYLRKYGLEHIGMLVMDESCFSSPSYQEIIDHHFPGVVTNHKRDVANIRAQLDVRGYISESSETEQPEDFSNEHHADPLPHLSPVDQAVPSHEGGDHVWQHEWDQARIQRAKEKATKEFFQKLPHPSINGFFSFHRYLAGCRNRHKQEELYPAMRQHVRRTYRYRSFDVRELKKYPRKQIKPN